MQPATREEQILNAGLEIGARQGGWNKLTLVEAAKQAGCTHGLVLHYFSTVKQFKRRVMREAIRTGNLSVIAQGLAAGDSCAQKASDEVKSQALNTLL